MHLPSLNLLDLCLQRGSLLYQAWKKKHGLCQVSITQNAAVRSRLARSAGFHGPACEKGRKRDKNVKGRRRWGACAWVHVWSRWQVLVQKMTAPQWGAPMGLAITEVEVYIRLCVSVHGGRLPHYIIHQPFMSLYTHIVVCALPCMCVFWR